MIPDTSEAIGRGRCRDGYRPDLGVKSGVGRGVDPSTVTIPKIRIDEVNTSPFDLQCTSVAVIDDSDG
jgi:hypothetical protein